MPSIAGSSLRQIETLVPMLRSQALACLGVKMSKNQAAHDSLRSRLAAVACVAPIMECIRKMRAEGLDDNEIAGLFRHAADELDEATASKDEKVTWRCWLRPFAPHPC
jgi:hypothetical protein